MIIQLFYILWAPALEPFAVGQNSKMVFIKSRRDGSESLSAYGCLLLLIESLEFLR
jgi:hypothetical protein